MNQKNDPAKGLPHRQDDWKGYTLDDLRYRRAYVAARKELEKERLYHNLHNVRKGAVSTAAGTARRVASAVPFLDYAMIAWSVGSKAFKLLGKFRKKK